MAMIDIRNLSFRYPDTPRDVLDDVSLSVPDGAFTVLAGPVGSGKTTLLRHLKPELAPRGTQRGDVLLDGQPVSALTPEQSAARIGYVMQDPDAQIVTDTVWHELAFGLENLAVDPQRIRRRVAELASYFGITGWFHQPCATLSSGQKQMLALASVMSMQPDVLVLDEPTAQLDPIAAGEFLQFLERIHRELGVTVVLSEQRLEDTLPLADRVVVLADGAVAGEAAPAEILASLRKRPEVRDTLRGGLPVAMQVAWLLGSDADRDGPLPLTPRDGRLWLQGRRPLEQAGAAAAAAADPSADSADFTLTARDLWFRYRRDLPDILKGLSLSLRDREIHAVLGANGSGKSTLLSVLGGLDTPQKGRIRPADTSKGAILLSADPRALLIRETVGDELAAAGIGEDHPVPERLGLTGLTRRHPMDLSTGERQKVALALALARPTPVLLLDEPTRGLDPSDRATVGALLRDRAECGTAVLLVTHDVEFAAVTADCCSLLFDGEIVSSGPPPAFFAGNRFYTTAAARMTRDLDPPVVTVRDLLDRWGVPE